MVSFTSVCNGRSAGLQRLRTPRASVRAMTSKICSSVSRRELMILTGTHRVQKEGPIMTPRRDLGRNDARNHTGIIRALSRSRDMFICMWWYRGG